MSTGLFFKQFLDAMRRKFGAGADTICQGNDVRLSVGTFNQEDEPTTAQIPAGQFGFWTDTGDSKCYLCYTHGGTVKTVELT